MAQTIMTPQDMLIADDVMQFFFDPTGYVRYAFPWSEEGPLSEFEGPDDWQVGVMDYVRDTLPYAKTALRIAISSGHGVGKSALVSWLIHWFMSTRPECAIVATANTKTQLQTKLWRELALWKSRAINGHWFDWQATSFKSVELPATWVANAIPWSEQNPEAFAGLHARDTMVLFDEASAIHSSIWEVVEGAMTTPNSVFIVLGNPTRSSGRFYDCFNDHAKLWKTFTVDSRSARMANKAQIDQWIDLYGDDSDFIRVRVRGEFPHVGDVQFIPTNHVLDSMERVQVPIKDDYLVMGLDVARFGPDASVITFRTSNYVFPQIEARGLDTMQVAARAAEEINRRNPTTVFVDGVGLGAGVVDRLRNLGFTQIIDVQSAASPDKPIYENKRAEMWGNMKEWLRGDVALSPSESLKSGLLCVEYGYNARGKLQLESKADIKRRGLPSPDHADSLALTFAHPIRTVRDFDSYGWASGVYECQQSTDWRAV